MNAKNGNDQYDAKKLVKNHGYTHHHYSKTEDSSFQKYKTIAACCMWFYKKLE